MERVVRWIAALSVAAALSAGPAAAEEAPDNRAALKSSISKTMLEYMGADGIEELVESGLAEPDAKRIMDRFVSGAAECILTVAEERIVQIGGDPRDVMSTLQLDDFRDLFEDEASFERRLKGCLMGVAADAGLSLN